MLMFGCSVLVLLFPRLPVFVPIICWLYHVRQLQLVSLSLLCSIVFFKSLARSRYFFSCFSSILTCGQLELQSSQFGRFLFFFLISLGLTVWLRLGDKIPEMFLRLIIQDGLWVQHIPSVPVVKFKLLAQFPVDHLPYLVVCSLILCLRLLTAFAYNMIDRFVYQHMTYICYFFILSILALI